MAVVGNSYLYHMRKDLVENIEPGVAQVRASRTVLITVVLMLAMLEIQHMADNVHALLLHLTSSDSPLPELATTGYTKPQTVFFEHFGYFLVYSFTTAKILYTVSFVLALIVARGTFVNPAPALKKGTSFLGEQIKGIVATSGAFIGAVVGVNVVAFIMDKVLGKSFSWFTSVFAPVFLYGPAALSGAVTCVPSILNALTSMHFVARRIDFATHCWPRPGADYVFVYHGRPILPGRGCPAARRWRWWHPLPDLLSADPGTGAQRSAQGPRRRHLTLELRYWPDHPSGDRIDFALFSG